MEPPPLARYIPQKSKKRVFPGSSSSYMDPEVVEIAPPIGQSSKSNSKSLKQKEVIHYEVIDVDMDEDPADLMLTEKKIDPDKKGKEALTDFSNGHNIVANSGPVGGIHSSKKNCTLGPNNSVSVDGFSSDLYYVDDEYLETYYEDLIDDEYSAVQAHFDSIDFPPGVEAPIPWLFNALQDKKQMVSVNNLTPPILQEKSDSLTFPAARTSSRSCRFPEPPQIGKKSSLIGSSSLEMQMDAVNHAHGLELSQSLSRLQPNKSKKKLTALTSLASPSSVGQKGSGNIPFNAGHFKASHFPESPHLKRKVPVAGSATHYSPFNKATSLIKISSGNEPSSAGSYFSNSLEKQVGNSNLTNFNFFPNASNPPPGVDALQTWWQDSPFPPDLSSFYASEALDMFPGADSFAPWIEDPANCQKNATASGSSTSPCESVSSSFKHGNKEDIMKKFQDFKKFDTVQDHSDHHYARNGSSLKQPSKNWAKKIQEEWKILEKDLPDTIFVRVYESRMDLLRAVIVGAEGTPYHDGLFFFDVFFPCGYPNVPPHVYYHSGGLRINPNLYNSGKVCLSLLNTWSGNQNEKWIPGVSTMLQVLVSIQGLILNAKPYFNEPGFARMNGSASGELSSQQYNESTFILSLKTMVYSMRRPPKHFEDFVLGHFYRTAHDILVACKAYMDGAQVGCLVKGGVQDLDAGDKSCSQNFKGILGVQMNSLVQAFTQIGVKNCEIFISPSQKGNKPVIPAPKSG